MDLINMLMDSIINFYNFVISNVTIDAVIKFVVLYFFILWGAFIIWIVKDITNRTTNIFLQVVSILIVIFLTPIFGLPIYLLMRPRTTIFEKYYEEDELNEEAILENDADKGDRVYSESSCSKCGKSVSDNFKFCPYCEGKLTKNCIKCTREIKLERKACPYCGAHQKQEKVKKDGMKVEVEKVDKKKRVKEDILANLEEE